LKGGVGAEFQVVAGAVLKSFTDQVVKDLKKPAGRWWAAPQDQTQSL
jgi:hypothetical protein